MAGQETLSTNPQPDMNIGAGSTTETDAEVDMSVEEDVMDMFAENEIVLRQSGECSLRVVVCVCYVCNRYLTAMAMVRRDKPGCNGTRERASEARERKAIKAKVQRLWRVRPS